MLQNLNLISEFFCLLIAIYVVVKQKNSFLFAFAVYMASIFFVETIEHFILNIKTNWLTNLKVLYIFSFSAFVMKFLFTLTVLKRLLYILFIAYAMFWLLMITKFSNIETWDKHLINISFLVQIVFSLGYFYQSLIIINQQQANHHFGLWFCAGLIIFNTAMLLNFTVIKYVLYNKVYFHGLLISSLIAKLLCVILYGCFSIALLLWKPNINK